MPAYSGGLAVNINVEHFFIVNPVAGKGRALRLIPVIREYCEEKKLDYEIVITQYPGHATEIARAQSALRVMRFYSVGGDGTLNEVLNGMAGSGSSLACIPGGSGNDFIKSVADPARLKKLIKATIDGAEHLIDYAKVNNRYFLNIASVGFDAEVVYRRGHFKKLPFISGKMAYVLGILASIIKCDNRYMQIDIDGKTISGKTLLLAVGNGRYYGGGMLALPEARIEDGLFEICHVGEFKRLRILSLFPKYMKGLHASISGVSFYQGKKVRVVTDKPLPMNLDGEIALIPEASFEILPKGLPFVFPALPAAGPTQIGPQPLPNKS